MGRAKAFIMKAIFEAMEPDEEVFAHELVLPVSKAIGRQLTIQNIAHHLVQLRDKGLVSMSKKKDWTYNAHRWKRIYHGNVNRELRPI